MSLDMYVRGKQHEIDNMSMRSNRSRRPVIGLPEEGYENHEVSYDQPRSMSLPPRTVSPVHFKSLRKTHRPPAFASSTPTSSRCSPLHQENFSITREITSRDSSASPARGNRDFRSPHLNVLHEGWLCRKGWTYGTWKRSYAVLKIQDNGQGGMLALYRHDAETAPLTIHEASGIIEIKQRTRKSSPSFEFTLVYNKAEFVFASDNQEEILAWVALLQQVISGSQSPFSANNTIPGNDPIQKELKKLTEQSLKDDALLVNQNMELERKALELSEELQATNDLNEVLRKKIEALQEELALLREELATLQVKPVTPREGSFEMIMSAAELSPVSEAIPAMTDVESALRIQELQEQIVTMCNLAEAEQRSRSQQLIEMEQLRETNGQLSDDRNQKALTVALLETQLTELRNRICKLESENEELHAENMHHLPDHISAETAIPVASPAVVWSIKLDEVLRQVNHISNNLVSKADLQILQQRTHVNRLAEERDVLQHEVSELRNRQLGEERDNGRKHRRNVDSPEDGLIFRKELQTIYPIVKGKVHNFVKDIEKSEARLKGSASGQPSTGAGLEL